VPINIVMARDQVGDARPGEAVLVAYPQG
jgi:hypothetical protein